MASFNEWLSRRDEAFHQDRFDKAMDKNTGRALFQNIDAVERLADTLGNALGQLTRIKDNKIIDNLKKVLDYYKNTSMEDFAQENHIGSVIINLKNAIDDIRSAEKGMPDPSKSSAVAEIMKGLNAIKSHASAAGGNFIRTFGSKHAADKTKMTDRVMAGHDLVRHANFKRSGKFGPDKYPKPHSSDFNPTEDDVLVIGDE